MHGCIRLNIIRGLTIISLVLVIATSFIVVIFNFKDGPVSDTFFSSVNHLVLIASTFVLIASELRLFEKRFTRYLPLLGPDSSLFTLGLTQVPSPPLLRSGLTPPPDLLRFVSFIGSTLCFECPISVVLG
jgi:hypothetical protein